MQVIAESRRQCEAALRFLVEVRLAFPEVLQAIKTKQLAQEILLFKEDHIVNLAKTGNAPVDCYTALIILLYRLLYVKPSADLIVLSNLSVKSVWLGTVSVNTSSCSDFTDEDHGKFSRCFRSHEIAIMVARCQ